MACDFCENKLPWNTNYHAIWFSDELNRKTINVTNKDYCPPFADCCRKDMKIVSRFEIKYCPMCGRKLVSE